MNIGRKCHTRTTKTARGSATGATTTEVSATGSELDEDRRFSIKLEENFDVHTVHNDDNSFFRN